MRSTGNLNRQSNKSLWPQPGTYWFAGRPTPVIVVGLAVDCEVRCIFPDGTIRTIAEHRIRFAPTTLAAIREVAA